MSGEITLAGVTLTLEEWGALDQESQELLLSLAAVSPEGEALVDGARDFGEHTVHIPAMIDLLTTASR
jgi:hypothetical protein